MPRRHNKRPRHGSPILHTRRLRVEPLEDRRMLATYVVDSLEDNTLDDGLTTLREAIALVNAHSEADVIEFAPELFAEGPRTLSLLEVEDTALGGSALVVTSSMTIVGPGAELLTVDASPLDSTPDLDDGMGARLLRIDDALTNVRLDVSLSGMTLTGGDTPHSGGAIYSRENLTLTEMVITANHAAEQEEVSSSGFGGGLAHFTGDLTVERSRVANNTAEQRGGGIYSQGAVSRLLDSQVDGNVTVRYGGGIYHSGSELHVSGSQITSNRVIGDETDARGGGIYALSGPLYMDDTLIDGNTAGSNFAPAQGGGLYTGGIVQEIRNSTFSNNRSYGSGGGAWLNVPRGVFEYNSVSDNKATHDGGGVYLVFQRGTTSLKFQYNSVVRNTAFVGGGLAVVARDEATPRISDSVIAMNRAYGSGGGIHLHAVASASVTIDRSTVAHNLADVDATLNGIGDGIMIETGHLAINGSIVAANGLVTGSSVPVAPDLGRGFTTTVALTHTLIGSNLGSGLAEAPVGSPDSNGNLIGRVHGLAIDPGLAPLGKYGGRLEVLPLLATSPAIDGANPADEAGMGTVPEFDLRGTPYTRVWSPEGVEPARIDMGSTEFQPYPGGTSLLVDTLEDEFDANISAGDLSLREAVAIANGHTGTFEIRFAPELFGGTIELELGEILIASDLAILGPGAELLTILGYEERPEMPDSDSERRLFRIDDGSAGSFAEVLLEGVTLFGGYVPSGGGGAISSVEQLTLRGLRAVNNYADGGGAVYSGAGKLTIESSQFLQNSAYDPATFRYADGGAIQTRDTDLDVRDSLFQDNEAATGGAILTAAFATPAGSREVRITGSRFADNRARDSGGGLSAVGMIVDVGNTVFEGNTARGLSASQIEEGGGAIYTIGSSLSLSGSFLFNNGRGQTGGPADGGGLLAAGQGDRFYPAVSNPTLVVSDTRFESNYVSGEGGALFTTGMHSVRIEGTTFKSNRALNGGGAYVSAASIDVINAIFQENTSTLDGGGLFVPRARLGLPNVTATISHSTFVGNSAGSDGGALFLQGAVITHSTFSENIATGGAGGAVLFDDPGPSPDRITHSSFIANRANTSPAVHRGSNNRIFTHTLFADNVNLNGDPVAPMFFTSLTLRHSFVDYKPAGSPYPETGLSSPDANGNYIGGPLGGPIDPMLGPLEYNGGPTPTHRPLPGSPLIDAGDVSFDPNDPDGIPGTDDAVLYDQRGEPFGRVKDGDDTPGAAIDIGAVEYDPTLTPGDYNGDRVVDIRDYLMWRNTLGSEVTPLTAADSSGNGTIDTLDYLVWRAHYGEAYPEPPVEEEAGALATASRTGEEPIVLLGTLCGVRGPVFRPSQRQGITAPPNHHARDAALRLLAESPAREAWPLAEFEEMNDANQSQGLLESARGRVRGQSTDDTAFDLGFMIFDLW